MPGAAPQRSQRGFLHELAARDLFIVVTELDVKEADYMLSAEQRDAAVAAYAKSFLDVALDEPRVIGVTTWGLRDRYSWLKVAAADLRAGQAPGATFPAPA